MAEWADCEVRRGLIVALVAAGVGVIGPLSSVRHAGAEPTKSGKEAKESKEVKETREPKESKDAFTRGKDFYEAGKYEESLSAFQQAEKKEPKDPIVQSWLGFISFKLNRNPEAIRYLNRSLDLSSNKDNPANADVYNNLGNAYLANKETDKAIDSYQRAVDILKNSPEKRADPYYNLGNALVQKGDLDGALAAFQDAEKLDPNDPLIQNNLGFVYERMHAADPAKNPLQPAIEHYQKARDTQPNNPVFQRNLALALRKQGGPSDETLKALQRAAELDPKNYDAHLALAEEFQNRTQTESAVKEYRQAAALRPGEFVPRYNLGLLYANQGNYSEATAQLTDAQRLQPKDERVPMALGWTYYKWNRPKEAAGYYQKAIDLNPSLQPAWANLGLVKDHLADTDGAISAYKQALRLKADDPATRALLAADYITKGRWDDSVTEYRTLLQRNAKDAGSWNNLGYAYEKQGKLNEAADAYQHAIDNVPPGTTTPSVVRLAAVAHNNLGAILQRKGEKQKAREHYQKALQLQPDFQDAKKNLANLGPG